MKDEYFGLVLWDDSNEIQNSWYLVFVRMIVVSVIGSDFDVLEMKWLDTVFVSSKSEESDVQSFELESVHQFYIT